MDLMKNDVGMRSYYFIRRMTQKFIFNRNINDTGSGPLDFQGPEGIATVLGDALIFSADADGTHGPEPYRCVS